jgi:hypothetical protein
LFRKRIVTPHFRFIVQTIPRLFLWRKPKFDFT